VQKELAEEKAEKL
jgi:oligoendopeptidase F